MTDAQIDSIMEQAQVFASAWSLVGGPFDSGGMLETAEQEKAALRALLASKPAVPEGWKPELLYGPCQNVCWTQDMVPRGERIDAVVISHADYERLLAATTAPAQSCGDAEQADEAATERHMRFLGLLQIGGCTCLTKTPELQYHAEDCKYRLAAEIQQALRARAKDSK